jgi:integrase
MERSATSSIRRRLVPRLPRRAWILIAGACGFYGSVGFVSAFLVIYLHDVRGIGLGIAGVALGATAFAGLASSPVVGAVADQVGAKPTLISLLAIGATDLRPGAVQAVMTKVLASRSPRTAVNTYRVLSEMLGEAARWGMIATNPAAAIRPPRAPRPDLHVPDAATCMAILERSSDRQVEGPVVLALGTGMRLGEILAARWKDVDLERKVLRVTATLSYVGGEFTFPQPKTYRARRSVDLPAFVVTFLKRQRKAQAALQMRVRDVWMDYGVVLSDEIGQPLAPWSVSTDFRRLTRELELPRTRFHDLRHAHPTQLLAAGVHPKAVSERLGHSSVAFTMDTNSAVIPSLGRAAADAADQLFG